MSAHLRGHVRAYVDRALPGPMLQSFDRHLVCCAMCRALADQERRIMSALRAETGVPQSLRSSLMGLAVAPLGQPSQVPSVPRPPLGHRMPFAPGSLEPLATVAPASPALHRSPVRAAVYASIAAGASVAAAWGLAVAPLPSGASGRPPVAGVPSGMATVAPASFAPALVGPVRSSANPQWTVSSWAWATTRPARSQPVVTTPVRFSLVDSAESRP